MNANLNSRDPYSLLAYEYIGSNRQKLSMYLRSSDVSVAIVIWDYVLTYVASYV